jgi:DNA-binding SARP family transcriptional activator/tetratricopeptide (TPR) repeat protein
LGPIELSVNGAQVDLGPARQRAVLAALAVDAGQPVGVDALIERVWGPDAQPGARSGLYSYLTRLRRVFAQAGIPETALRLVSRPGGYVLDVEPDRVDSRRFQRLVQAARASDGDDDWRADLLDQAIGLWRGPALAGLSGEWADRSRQLLGQERVDAVVLWAGVQLRRGRPDLVVGPLRSLTGEYPLVEPLAARLIEALGRAGRAAEALDCYAATRRRLIDELGAEPGPELRRLHQAVLTGDLEPPAPAAPPAARRQPAEGAGHRPAQLPLDVPGFAAREAELAALDAILAGAGEQPTAMVVAAVWGTAGVGKTSLAVHWAHRVAGRFPDGQLYVNLRSFDPAGPPVTAGEALHGFLDAVGVPAQRIPTGLTARAALFRSLLAGRRMLVVLDNAETVEQIRPLLPGAAGCLAVVTSRNELMGLVAVEGAYPLTLDVLPVGQARHLLVRRLGPARILAEQAAAEEIIARCAGLPLALAIVAACAATHPGLTLTALAGQLRAAAGGLDPFAGVDRASDLRAVFSWSYQALSPAAARLFRLLGLHPGPDFDAPAAASLAGLPAGELRLLLDELTRGHLVTRTVPGRYAFHDLLRSYAAEQAEARDAAGERRAALHRTLDHYVAGAHAAALALNPNRDRIAPPAGQPGNTPVGFADRDQAFEWLAATRSVLLAVLDEAARGGFDTHSVQLGWALCDFLDWQGYWHDMAATQATALAAALRLGDRSEQARAHRGLGYAQSRLDDQQEAHGQLQRALDLYGELGDRTGQAHAHRILALVLERQGRYGVARDHAQQALQLYRSTDHRSGQARTLNMIGWYSSQLGDHREALVQCQRALFLCRQAGQPLDEAAIWDSIGHAHHHLGHHRQAVACYRRALDLFRRNGDRYNEADVLVHLGDTQQATGATETAAGTWRTALAILDQLGHPDGAAVRAKLANAGPAEPVPGCAARVSRQYPLSAPRAGDQPVRRTQG